MTEPLSREEIERLLKLAEAATPGPWVAKQTIEMYGMTACRPVVSITSTGKPNRSFPGMPGIVAYLQGRERYEPTPAMRDEDLAFIAAARQAVPALCRQLLDAEAKLYLMAKLAKCQDEPQFFNPMEAMQAKNLRDEILAKAALASGGEG